MLRIFLGVTVGFVVWSILWVGVDATLRTVWTSYDESVKAMTFSSSMLIVPLVLSAVVFNCCRFCRRFDCKRKFKVTIDSWNSTFNFWDFRADKGQNSALV